ncbi:hypothetical protein [Bradyrhizobium sp. CCBAU 65884]|uniref:hypothetical protein n=1 Tax=Bradyrhizobium sp. CCBAU 65884 TaxID=722477 RepID=UPI002304DAFC|nr:hypothetical protein [Bradyrhizobium sp. CCBAU 65884]
MLTEHWRLNTDVAHLPWTDFKGRDNHLLRDRTTFYDQRRERGGDVQIEGVLSYFITKNFSAGVGGRYLDNVDQKGTAERHARSRDGEPNGPIQAAKYSKERRRTFFQASYKFD